MHAAIASPSNWITRWAHLIPAGGRVLDLACGSGRHLRWLTGQGFQATGVDRDEGALAASQGLAELIQADLENGPWPLGGRQFDGVVVTHYLWRPTWPHLLNLLAPGGVLLYETFAAGNQTVGKPSRPDFLLQPGELLQRCAGLRVLGYEDGFLDAPPRFMQRIAARRPAADDGPALRLPLPEASGGPGPAG